jgi:Fic family protein
MDYGVKRIKELPISSRLLREMHSILVKGTRGGKKSPGEFRKSQNWIGGSKPSNARFVPPPHQEVRNCMGDLEIFLNDQNNIMPIIIKAGLAHVQFETIHPFLDGNGRIGRLLITLILLSEKILEKPLLYLSLFFKKHRDEYYDCLSKVRTEGDWEGWIKFYLNGVYEVSKEGEKSARSIINLRTKHSIKVGELRKASDSALKLLDLLYKNPIQTVGSVSKSLKLSAPSSRKAINNLINLGILIEITGKKRDRAYWYNEYLSILLEDQN